MTKRKHKKGKEKKLRRQMRNRALICTSCGSFKPECCGPVVCKSDPRYHETLMKISKEKKKSGTPFRGHSWGPTGQKKIQQRQEIEERKKRGWAVPEDVLERKFNIPCSSSYWGGKDCLQLSDPVVDTSLAPKAGRKKKIGQYIYRMDVVNPIDVPFEEETQTLWHGTSLFGIRGIIQMGFFNPSKSGMLGPGVYLGPKQKAINYMRGTERGVMLQVEVALGRVVESSHPRFDRLIQNHNPRSFDTLHACRSYKHAWGGRLRNKEWCVRDPLRVQVRSIFIVPQTLRR